VGGDYSRLHSTFSNLFIISPEEPDGEERDGNDLLPNPIFTLYTHDQLEKQVNYTINQFFVVN